MLTSSSSRTRFAPKLGLLCSSRCFLIASIAPDRNEIESIRSTAPLSSESTGPSIEVRSLSALSLVSLLISGISDSFSLIASVMASTTDSKEPHHSSGIWRCLRREWWPELLYLVDCEDHQRLTTYYLNLAFRVVPKFLFGKHAKWLAFAECLIPYCPRPWVRNLQIRMMITTFTSKKLGSSHSFMCVNRSDFVWLRATSKTIPLYPAWHEDRRQVTSPFFLLIIPPPPVKENIVDSVTVRRAKIPPFWTAIHLDFSW